MAIQDASATLESQFEFTALRGYLNLQEAEINYATGYLQALPKASSWLSAPTWDSFNSYRSGTNPIRWTAPVIDLGSSVDFCLEITCVSDGVNRFIVHTSDTGLFAGEETETEITQGDLDIEGFTGRYVAVTMISTATIVERFSVTATQQTQQFWLRNIDTSTLAGSITERQIPIDRPLSKITDIVIQPRAATTYAVNLYVSDTATSQVVIPVVKSKSSTPTFALYGIDNDARDSVVDIQISGLPRMAAVDGGIIVIT